MLVFSCLQNSFEVDENKTPFWNRKTPSYFEKTAF